MAYQLEDLYQSLNDIYYQVDEGKMTLQAGEFLAKKCCYEFIGMCDVKEWKETYINE